MLEIEGRGDQSTTVDERRAEELRLWQAFLNRRDWAVTELAKSRGEAPPETDPEPLPDVLEPLGELDDEEVRYAAEIGRWIPQFEYYSPFRRWIAMKMSRVVLFLTGFISVHQRRYNHLVLDKMAATQERLDELVDAVNLLSERMEGYEIDRTRRRLERSDGERDDQPAEESADLRSEEPQEASEEPLAETEGDTEVATVLEERVSAYDVGLDTLRREVHRLQCEVLAQTAEVADLQAARVGDRIRELDLLTDSRPSPVEASAAEAPTVEEEPVTTG